MNWPTSRDRHDQLAHVVAPIIAALIVVGLLAVIAYLWTPPS